MVLDSRPGPLIGERDREAFAVTWRACTAVGWRYYDETLRIRRDIELPVYEHLGDTLSTAICWGRIADIAAARVEWDEAAELQRGRLAVIEQLFGECGGGQQVRPDRSQQAGVRVGGDQFDPGRAAGGLRGLFGRPAPTGRTCSNRWSIHDGCDESSKIVDKELGLFEGWEVSAARHARPSDDVVGAVEEAAWRGWAGVGECCETGWHLDAFAWRQGDGSFLGHGPVVGDRGVEGVCDQVDHDVGEQGVHLEDVFGGGVCAVGPVEEFVGDPCCQSDRVVHERVADG